MSSEVVDVIVIDIMDVLLSDENGKTGFEDLIYIRGGEFGEGFDMQFYAAGKGERECGTPSFRGRRLVQLLADYGIGVCPDSFEPLWGVSW